MKWHFSQKIIDNGLYNALARRNNATINLLFTDKKNFDLKQTVTKEYKEHKEHKDLKDSY